MTPCRVAAVLAGLLALLALTRPALAVTAEVTLREPSVSGAPAVFRLVAADAVGVVEFRWDFGDGEQLEFTQGLTEVEHVYAQPGHYPVIVIVRDEVGLTSVSFVHTVHTPLLPGRARSSTSIIYDESRSLICNVNPDNDSVSCLDAASLEERFELPVYGGPESLALTPQGKLWVLHRDDYAVAIVDLDGMRIEGGFRLPYASQPMGLVMSPSGDAAYVTLMATGRLLKLDPNSGEPLAMLEVGRWARGLSVSHDGQDVYVTRFLSGQGLGEVLHVDGPTMQLVRRFELPEDTTTEDTDQQGRGLPNYLFSIGLSPDGREAWVPAKKDNMARGLLRDGLELTQDNTVRPMVAILDLGGGVELLESRIDLDDRNLPAHIEFSPLGDYAFVTLIGSNLVEVRDAYTKGFVTAMRGAGLGPTSCVLTPAGRLFVHAFLSRSVVVYDVANILSSGDQTTQLLASIPVVEVEALSPEVLLGKQIFYNSEDVRMAQEGYLSCASCHFDGFEDGRVWEFSDRGEGLRNTTSLLGRRGTGHGRVHWSANFDEIQDFEAAIRAGQGGAGFLDDTLFLEGTRSEPLGDPKAGLSPELDAMAAYVSSLDRVHPSPFRNSDGSLTAEAEAGQTLFGELGCPVCHAGDDFTDSAGGELRDVGTLKATSGSRLGEPLLGIDTPTLLGIWETAPYLHDGSAPTLGDVLTTNNAGDAHGPVSALQAGQIEQLVAYLQQVDDNLPPRVLPFELMPVAPGQDPAAGTPPATDAAPTERPAGVDTGCVLARPGRPSTSMEMLLVVALALLGRRRAAPAPYSSPSVASGQSRSALSAAILIRSVAAQRRPSDARRQRSWDCPRRLRWPTPTVPALGCQGTPRSSG